VVHFGSADVNPLIRFALNSEMFRLAQVLNAAKPKLMMRGERHVLMGATKTIMTKSHPLLFPEKKRYHASMNAASIPMAINQDDKSIVECVIVSHSVTDYA
jgi:hypothetical protein